MIATEKQKCLESMVVDRKKKCSKGMKNVGKEKLAGKNDGG